MSDQNKIPLEEELRNWEVHIEPDPRTAQHVLNRIASVQTRQDRRIRSTMIMPYVMAAGMAAVLVLGAVFIINQRAQTRLLQNHQYIALIDPVKRAAFDEGIPAGDRLLEQLSWMQDRLQLSREQFMQLVALHQNYSDQFDGLYRELVSLGNEYDHFEELRKEDKMVDFMALYEVLTHRKEAESTAHDLSQELISRVASILTPSQRTAYLSMVQPGTNPNA